jgi:hypothetical protein
MKRMIFWALLAAAGILAGCNMDQQDLPDEAEDESSQEVPAKAAPAPALPPFELLKWYRGANLTTLNEAQSRQLLDAITKLVPGREYEELYGYWPQHFWEFPNGAQPLYLLVDVNSSRPHPSSTGIRITVFKSTGAVLSESEFSTGHRCYLHSIYLEGVDKAQQPFIVLETGPGTGPCPDTRKQVYAHMEGRFDLVRLEDSNGEATRNRYYVNHFTCGPKAVRQTAYQWEADILCGDRLKVLRTLVWLGGKHWDQRPGDKPDSQFEAPDEIQLVRSVRAREKVVARVKELCKSKDRWLREAAMLAASPEDARWER